MFHEVRVMGKKGELKEIISPKKLSRQFWNRHTQPQEFSGKQVYEESEYELESSWDSKLSSKKKPELSEDADY